MGAGKSGADHLTAMQRLEGRALLVAAADLDEARLEVAQAHGIPATYTEHDAGP